MGCEFCILVGCSICFRRFVNTAWNEDQVHERWTCRRLLPLLIPLLSPFFSASLLFCLLCFLIDRLWVRQIGRLFDSFWRSDHTTRNKDQVHDGRCLIARIPHRTWSRSGKEERREKKGKRKERRNEGKQDGVIEGWMNEWISEMTAHMQHSSHDQLNLTSCCLLSETIRKTSKSSLSNPRWFWSTIKGCSSHCLQVWHWKTLSPIVLSAQECYHCAKI